MNSMLVRREYDLKAAEQGFSEEEVRSEPDIDPLTGLPVQENEVNGCRRLSPYLSVSLCPSVLLSLILTDLLTFEHVRLHQGKGKGKGKGKKAPKLDLRGMDTMGMEDMRIALAPSPRGQEAMVQQRFINVVEAWAQREEVCCL